MRTRNTGRRRGESTENIPLPSELWWEVMARLPAKSLLKFRCVSKQWCSTVDSPNFISAHHELSTNNPNKPHLLVMENTNNHIASKKYSLSIRDKSTFSVRTKLLENVEKTWTLLGSCNGLVLYQVKKSFISFPSLELAVWNPSINKSLIVPPCPLPTFHAHFVLGYISSTNDYEVVAFVYKRECANHMSSTIAVFSLKDNLWRTITLELDTIPSFVVMDLFSKYWRDHFSKGAAHWVITEKNDTCVLSFDFSVHEFSYVGLPDTRSEMLKYVFVLGESLAVFGISSVQSCIWIMRKDGGGKDLWSVWFSGDSTLGAYNFFKSSGYANIFYDGSSCTFSILTSEDELKSYNIISRQMQNFGRVFRDCDSICHCVSYADTFVESLVLSRGYHCQSLVSFPKEDE